MSDVANSPAKDGGRRTWFLLALILAVALAVRLISITHEAVWYDEVMILLHLDSPNVVQFLRDALPRTPVPPGFMISEYLWSQLVGTNIVALRVWPLICGIAGLGAFFMLGRRLLSARIALMATLWMSFVYWHIHYSQEIRYYPLALLLSMLSMLTFVELCATPKRKWLALNVLLNAAMVWTHPISVFLCAAQFAFLLLFRRKWIKVIGAWTGLHLLIGLSLYAFLQSLNQEAAYAQAAWINVPTLWGRSPSMRNLVSMYSGVITLQPTNDVGRSVYSIEPFTSVALILLHIIGAIFGARAILRLPGHASEPNRPLPPRQIVWLLLLWLILPPVIVFTVSHIWRPMFIVRYVLFAAPPLYLLLAQFLTQHPRIVAVTAFTLLLAHDALYYFPGPSRLPFNRLAETIESESTRPALIYLDDMLGKAPIEYYWKGEKPEFASSMKRDDVLDPKKRPVNKDIWLVFTNQERAEKYERVLTEESIEFRSIRLPAGKAIWLFQLIG